MNNPAKVNNSESLSQRAIKGGFWVFSIRLADQILFLIRITVLARLLSPHDFGLMGIAMLTMAVIETFSQTGFQAALIQKKERTQDYLDSAWTILIIRGFLLFIIISVAAPHVATFFNSPESKLIIQVFGLAILFRAFTNIGVIYFQKELEFSRQFLYELSGILTHFVVMIVLAVILRNAWALVLGFLAKNFIQFIVSYIIHPYRPRFHIEMKKVRELFSFGKWVLGSSVLVFLVTQGDDIFVGKILGATMLGFYQLAYKISNTPTTEISHVIAQVTFPTYSKLQDDPLRIKEAYLRVLQLTSFLAFPLAGLIFVLTPEFVLVFLGEKWTPMVPAMQALALAALVRALVGTTGPLFHGTGKPKVETFWEMVRLGLLVILIYPLTMKWGILGTSVAVLVSLFFSNIGFSWNAIKIAQISIKNYMKIVSIPMTSIFLSVLCLFMMKKIIHGGIVGFLILGCTGIVLYTILVYILDKLFGCKIFLLAKQSLSMLKKI